MSSSGFFMKLREEMQQSRDRRFKLQLAKVTSMSSLLGIGTLLIEKLELNIFFYLIPFIPIAFDIFILAISFHIRRIATFISNEGESVPPSEAKWESFVSLNPDRFARIANLLITTLFSVASCTVLIYKSKSFYQWIGSIWNIIWLIILFIVILAIKITETRLSRKDWKMAKTQEIDSVMDGQKELQ